MKSRVPLLTKCYLEVTIHFLFSVLQPRAHGLLYWHLHAAMIDPVCSIKMCTRPSMYQLLPALSTVSTSSYTLYLEMSNEADCIYVIKPAINIENIKCGIIVQCTGTWQGSFFTSWWTTLAWRKNHLSDCCILYLKAKWNQMFIAWYAASPWPIREKTVYMSSKICLELMQSRLGLFNEYCSAGAGIE